MKKVLWFLLGGAALGLAVYYFLFAGKSDREAILERARKAKEEKAKEAEAAPANGTI